MIEYLTAAHSAALRRPDHVLRVYEVRFVAQPALPHHRLRGGVACERTCRDLVGADPPEPVLDERRGALGREAAPPARASQPVAELLLAGIDAVRSKMKPAVELAGGALLGGPVPEERRLAVDREPARQEDVDVPLARRRCAEGDVAHHLRVGIELDQPVDVVGRELTQPQSRRL